MKIIIKIISSALFIVIMSSCEGNSKYQNIKLYEWEVSTLTNAVYKLAGSDIYTDSQRKRVVKYILDMRGKTEYEWNVVDVLEGHPELFGYFGEDDVRIPEYSEEPNYKRAEKIVNQIIS